MTHFPNERETEGKRRGMTKRFIRLKELNADMDTFYTPADSYLDTAPLLRRNEIYHVCTDSEGNQPSAIRNVSKHKIWLVGDSTVESIYLRAGSRPHSLIERYLLVDGYDVEVMNLGVSGAQLLNVINLIINKLGGNPGTTVVVSLPINNVGPLSYVDGYHSRHWRHASIVPADTKVVVARPDYDFDLYRRMLNLLVTTCRSLELDLLLTSVCHRGGIARFELLNQHARRFAQEQDIPFLDLEQEQSGAEGFFYDDAHFLPLGAGHYARRVADALKPRLSTESAESKVLAVCRIPPLIEGKIS
jgi:lysophospholipase L1-like esterase